jgi:hypothetical protein
MTYPEFDPRFHATTGIWVEEAAEISLSRLPAFGRRFFQAVFSEFPESMRTACFLRWSVQPDDVYATLHFAAGGLGIQIDPDLNCIIILTDATSHAEYGDWNGDQVASALSQVREFSCQTPRPSDSS